MHSGRNYYVMLLFFAILISLPTAYAVVPQITVNSPANGTINRTVGQTVQINVTTDITSNVTYRIGGGTINVLFNSNTNGFVEVPLVNFTEGINSITINATNSTTTSQSNATIRNTTLNIAPDIRITDNTPQATLQIGNTSQNITLQANVTPSGGAAEGVNVTFVLPYGIENKTACSSIQIIGFSEFRCTISLSNIQNQTNSQANVTVAANISAYTTYGSQNLTFSVNCTDGGICIQNSTSKAVTAANFFKNPRPDAVSIPANLTFIFSEWQQSESEYKVQVPIHTFDTTLGRPVLANNSYGEILFFDKSFFEFPSFMKLYSYNLTFRLVFSSFSQNATVIIRSPVNNTQETNQGLVPLLVQKFQETDFISNQTRNFTSAFPSPSGFTVYINRSINTTQSSLAQQGIDITVSNTNQDQQLLVLNITNPASANNTEFTIQFTLANVTQCGSGQCSRSPIFVNSQSVGSDFFQNAPPFGQTVNFTYSLNATNLLNNYTLSNLKASFMLPMNVTMNSTTKHKQFNMTQNVTVQVFNGTAWIASGFVRTNSNVTFEDKEFANANITLFISTFDVDITNASVQAFNSWNPGSSPVALINFSSELTFPVIDEFNNTPATAGSTNEYNATVQLSQRAAVNVTEKVPGLTAANCPTASACSVNITINGQQLDSSNFTIGSLVLKDVGAGTNLVTVKYTIPATSAASSGGSSSSGGGGGTPVIRRIATWLEMPPGLNVMRVAHTLIGIKEISINVTNRANNVRITVTKLDGKPASVTREIEGKVYQYIEIVHENLAEGNLQSVEIKFSIPKAWLLENKADKNNIVISRYTGSEWQNLESSIINDTADEINYMAVSPGLSVFAIRAAEEAPQEEPPAQPPSEPEPFVPTDVPPEPQPPQAQEIAGNEILIGVLIGVVFVIIYIFYAKSWKRRK